jgi:hypothetical protein
MDIMPNLHQAALVAAPIQYPQIPYFFLIGGYGCGKSFSGDLLILDLYRQYNGTDIVIGIGGTSQTLLRKTLLADLFRVLKLSGIRYKHNKQENIITIGTVTFIYISVSDPETVFAYNFSIFICDELDELPQEKAIAAFTAIQERCRVQCPDGRSPYAVFMTTAQGLKGTYRIICDLDEKKIPYIKIRGLTKDNTALDKAYVDRLYSLYTPIEAEAFLEGKFVNLYTGRVYPEYNDIVHSYMPFPLKDGETIYIGQDLNSGFSKAAVFVERGECIFGVAEFSFNVVADAPRILRATFPSQHIVWLPDASAKEIMAGYMSEIAEAGIELVMRTMNPSVTERILVVNKLFRTGRLKLFTTMKQYSLGLKTRQFDDDGNPSKGKGALAPDHICDASEYALWYIIQASSFLRDFCDALRITKNAA